jgi:putative redox protein
MSIEIRRNRQLQLGHTVSFASQTLPVDVSRDGGGDDSGPSPHDLYDAALGACKALTLVWYARRKSIPVEDLAVSVERDASQERAGRYQLTTTIKLGGDLSEAQLTELLAVAEKCPIHKLMTRVETVIHTTVTRMI